MSIRPISFKSLQVLTMPGTPTAPIPDLIKATFRYNKDLSSAFVLNKDIFQHDEEMDGTIHNATKDFALFLDKKFKKDLPDGSKKVILSEGTFTINPRETEKRYFLTTSGWKEEKKLLNILNKGGVLIAVAFK